MVTKSILVDNCYHSSKYVLQMLAIKPQQQGHKMKQFINADPQGKIAVQGHDPISFHTVAVA